MPTRTVVGPVVVLPDATTGLIKYYYQGAVLPDGLDEDRVKSVIADGLVSEDQDAGEMTVDDLRVDLAGDRLRAAGRPAVEPAAGGDGPPPKTANKAAWVDFAVSQGADRAEAEAASKDDLVATYGA